MYRAILYCLQSYIHISLSRIKICLSPLSTIFYYKLAIYSIFGTSRIFGGNINFPISLTNFINQHSSQIFSFWRYAPVVVFVNPISISSCPVFILHVIFCTTIRPNYLITKYITFLAMNMVQIQFSQITV